MFYAHSESAQLDRSNESVRAQADTTRRGRQGEVQNLKALAGTSHGTNFTRLGFIESKVPVEPCETALLARLAYTLT